MRSQSQGPPGKRDEPTVKKSIGEKIGSFFRDNREQLKES